MRYITRTLCVLALLGADDAAALGLGEMTVHSRLGEPFRAEVQLIERSGDDAALAECFRLGKPPSEDLPTLVGARLTLERAAGRSRLSIVSTQAIREPVLQVSLRAGCGAEVTRNYSVFIDPASLPAERPGSGRRASADAPPSLPRQAPARASAGQWLTGEGESLQAIADALFPGQPSAQRRFLLAARQANPEVDFGPQGGNTLPAGTRLEIPPARRHKPLPAPLAPDASPAPVAAKPAAPKAPVARPPSPVRATDRLMLSDTLDVPPAGSDELPLRMATELSGATTHSASESQRAVLRMEYRLLASLNEQASQQLAVAEQIRNLETSLARLQGAAEDAARAPGQPAVSGETPTISLPVAAPEPPVAPPPRAVARRAPESAVDKTSPATLDGLLLLAAAIGAIALLVWYAQRRFRRSAAQESVAPIGYPSALPAEEDLSEPLGETTSGAPERAAEAKAGVPFASDTRMVDSMSSLSGHSQGSVALTEHNEFNPVMELAEVMLSFGRVKGAAQALQEYIEQNPADALQPWMKLLEIYRQNNLREEFDQWSARLPLQFNVARVDWDSPLLLQQSPSVAAGDEAAALDELFNRLPNLAALPHIREKIAALWGSEECPVYLSHLLRDNRNGERTGFSLGAVRELLLLADLVEKHLKT